jgi:RNA polymerase-associated protein RTF1
MLMSDQKEFTRIVRVYEADKLKLPSRRQAEKKAAHIVKLSAQALTEVRLINALSTHWLRRYTQADITAMLARRNQMGKKQNAMAVTMEKSRLNQARTLALRRNDLVEVAQIDAQLAALTGDSTPARSKSNQLDELAKLNERNRKANMEAARKAEMLEAERKRSNRKLAMQANGTATPPSDRLKLLKNPDSRFVPSPPAMLEVFTDICC